MNMKIFKNKQIIINLHGLAIFILFIVIISECDNYRAKVVVPKWEPLKIFSSCNKVAIGSEQVLVVTDKGEFYAWGSFLELM